MNSTTRLHGSLAAHPGTTGISSMFSTLFNGLLAAALSVKNEHTTPSATEFAKPANCLEHTQWKHLDQLLTSFWVPRTSSAKSARWPSDFTPRHSQFVRPHLLLHPQLLGLEMPHTAHVKPVCDPGCCSRIYLHPNLRLQFHGLMYVSDEEPSGCAFHIFAVNQVFVPTEGVHIQSIVVFVQALLDRCPVQRRPRLASLDAGSPIAVLARCGDSLLVSSAASPATFRGADVQDQPHTTQSKCLRGTVYP